MLIYTVVYGLIGSLLQVIALIGNSLIIVFFGFKKRRKTPYSIFILALAVSDLTGAFMCLVTVLQLFIFKFPYLCFITSGLIQLCLGISAFLVVGMSYERYRGITKPINSRKPKKKHVVIYCVLVCIGWLVYGIPVYIPMIDDLSICTYDIRELRLYYLVSVIFVKSIIPSILMWFFYFNTKQSLKQHQQSIESITAFRRNVAVLKTLKLLIIFFEIFVVIPSFLPPVNIILIRTYGIKKIWNYLLDVASEGSPVINNIVNCFVYAGYDMDLHSFYRIYFLV